MQTSKKTIRLSPLLPSFLVSLSLSLLSPSIPSFPITLLSIFSHSTPLSPFPALCSLPLRSLQIVIALASLCTLSSPSCFFISFSLSLPAPALFRRILAHLHVSLSRPLLSVISVLSLPRATFFCDRDINDLRLCQQLGNWR